MLQQLQSIFQPDDGHQARELEAILSELTWDQERQCYYGSQSAVARITGMARNTIKEGLGLRDDRAAKRPKLLKWLAGEGISAAGIQREWQAGAISDRYIAKLIVYAASEASVRTPEARRWLNLITGVGFRGAIHQMKGREDILDRADARAKNLPKQRRVCDKIQQQGKSYQQTRAKIVEGVTGMVPAHLKNVAKRMGINIKNTWRDHADAQSLGAVSMAEDGYAITGSEATAAKVRAILMEDGWDGVVRFSEERVTCNDARDLGKLKRQ